MLLRFGAVKLKTKKIIFDEDRTKYDLNAVNKVKELICRRKSIEEVLNNSGTAPETTVSEYLARGPSSRSQQDLQVLEQYLPFLSHFGSFVESIPSGYIPSLTIQWSSALTSSCCIKIGGPKFFRVNTWQFELGMSHFQYGAVLRERAYETLSTDLVEAATLFRRAAGVYSYLADRVLPALKHYLTRESPVEATPSFSSIMSLISLADAQAVTIRKAEEKGTGPALLAKLHYGIIQMLDEAGSIITSTPEELHDLSHKFKDFLSTCKVFHEFRSQRYQAEELRGNEQIGVAINFLQHAKRNAKKAKIPKTESYCSVLSKEVQDLGEMLKKFEHENEVVWNQKIPTVNISLTPDEGRRIVRVVPYEPRKWDET